MAITSYATLLDAAIRWSGSSSDSNINAAAADAVAMCEGELNNRLRVPEMISRSRATMTGEYESLPPGTLKLISVGKVGSTGVETPLDPISPAQWPDYPYAATGEPYFYALVGAQVRFKPAPTPDSTTLIRFTYYGSVPALADTNPCTAILTRYPNMYLYGTLKHLAAYVNDGDAVVKWSQMFESALTEANRSAILRDPATLR